jgi:hypothetical protein
MDVWLINDLLAKPATLSRAAKYTVMNGVLYLCAGALLFPHLLGTFAILDPALAMGAWVIALARRDAASR